MFSLSLDLLRSRSFFFPHRHLLRPSKIPPSPGKRHHSSKTHPSDIDGEKKNWPTSKKKKKKKAAAADTASYLSSVALCQPPARLQALCAVLAACGASPLSAADRRGLHPLVVPLASFSQASAEGRSAAGGGGARGETPQAERLLSSLLPRGPAALPSSPPPSSPSSDGAAAVVVGLLRVPSERRGLQVVSCARGAPAMELLARSADELLVRLLFEEEAAAATALAMAMAAAAAAQPARESLTPLGVKVLNAEQAAVVLQQRLDVLTSQQGGGGAA